MLMIRYLDVRGSIELRRLGRAWSESQAEGATRARSIALMVANTHLCRGRIHEQRQQ